MNFNCHSRNSLGTVLLLLSCLAVGSFFSSAPGSTAAEGSGSRFDRLLAQARFLKKTRQYQAALPLFQKLVRMRPGDAEAHAGLGWVEFSLGGIDAGMKEEVKAIGLNPKNADAHHHLATMYLTLNMLPQAADEFRAALKLDPKKECNCGPVAGLLWTYPPGSGSRGAASAAPTPPQRSTQP